MACQEAFIILEAGPGAPWRPRKKLRAFKLRGL